MAVQLSDANLFADCVFAVGADAVVNPFDFAWIEY